MMVVIDDRPDDKPLPALPWVLLTHPTGVYQVYTVCNRSSKL
jgi:hypothetical protein